MNNAHPAFSLKYNEFWRTPSESQRIDQNSSLFGALYVRDGMWEWASDWLNRLRMASYLCAICGGQDVGSEN